MLTQLFLKLTFVGAEWVMWILLLLSIISIALMVEPGAAGTARAERGGELGRRERLLGLRGQKETGLWISHGFGSSGGLGGPGEHARQRSQANDDPHREQRFRSHGHPPCR
jgi:hypothetical protein